MSFVSWLARIHRQRISDSRRWAMQSSKLYTGHQGHLTPQSLRSHCSKFSSRSHNSAMDAGNVDVAFFNQKRQSDRPLVAQTPLRRTAQATRQQRQREIKRASSPGPSTFVTAYCAAEAYNIHQVARILEKAGHRLNTFDTNLAPHVVHFQKPSSDATRTSDERSADVFILASGTVVVWGPVESTYVSGTLLPALAVTAEKAHEDAIEIEDLEFCQDQNSENSHVNGDIITLGTRASNFDEPNAAESPKVLQDLLRQHETGLILAKVAFSFGLARSTKVAILESQLERYFISTRDIPMMLKSGTKLPYSRRFVLQKIGELLSMRSQLNLSSELTDSLPNVFWDTRYELGLEGYFVQVSRALDIGERIRALNDKMTYAQDIASVLQDRLSERHGFLLEWLIIALISVEICIEITRLVKERLERNDPNNLDLVIRRYLEREEGRNSG